MSPAAGVLQPEPLLDLLTGQVYGYRAVPVTEDGGQRPHVLSMGSSSPDGQYSTTAPGMPRGINFGPPPADLIRSKAADNNDKRAGAISLGKILVEPPREEKVSGEEAPSLEEHPEEAPIDSLLPTAKYSFKAPNKLGGTSQHHHHHATMGGWARSIPADQVPLDYETVVAELAFPFPFELDTFQKQAIYHLERSESVFVAAHTSAGKTVVAEYAIALAHRHLTKAIYTSPIKALSNQKFRDFRHIFGEAEVGLLTGDVQLNPDAPCLIMTTEILRSMLYRGADLVSDVEFVIFDEVHYVNDQDRGVVWEEVIIMLPPHVTIIMLSATIPNTMEFADWVGRTKQKEIFVISTTRRPVPLEHFVYVDRQEIVKIVDERKTFLEAGYKRALQIQRGESKGVPAADGKDGKKSAGPTKSLPNMVAGAVAPRNTQGGIYRGIKQEKTLWIDVVYLLKKRALLPAVIFTFSRRKCEENADALSSTDLNGASEKSAIRVFLDRSVAKLRVEDRALPQIQRMRELLALGIAVHHSGLLPLMKEAVEILFSRGLVKVLFATETFAMGVNMPTRTVVFSSIRKHDGTGFRNLLPGEYTQMAGRAGRRGLDPTGTVIIACPEEVPAEATLRTTILGVPTKLTSQFRLTYTMLLNLIRVQALRVEEMLKSSFSEHAGQRERPQEEAALVENEQKLREARPLECPLCQVDIAEFYGTSVTILEAGRYVWERLLADQRLTGRLLEPGRIVLINNGLLRNTPVVVLQVLANQQASGSNCLSCLALWNDPAGTTDREVASEGLAGLLTTPLPLNMVDYPDLERPLRRDTFTFGPAQLVLISSAKIRVPAGLGTTTRYRPKDLDDIQDSLVQWLQAHRGGPLEELELPIFKLLDVDERRLSRQSLVRSLPNFACNRCPDLATHYGIFHSRQVLTERMAELQFRLSDSSLALLPEYHSRLDLLKSLGYVDQLGQVQVKGRVACELNTVHELVTTELLFDNAFGECEPPVIVALLSAMVFQERTGGRSAQDELEALLQAETTDPQLRQGIECLQTTALRLRQMEREHGVAVPEQPPLNFGLVEVVYQWARGTPFTTIMELTEVLEGSIVRCIVRLDESCRELRGAARIMGDPVLFRKMEEASRMIKRDICFAASLYL